MIWLGLALGALLGSALAALLLGRARRLAAGCAAAGVAVAAGLALPTVIGAFGGDELTARLAWAAPVEEIRLGLDPLTAFFAAPLLVLAALCAIYGAVYLDAEPAQRRTEIPAALFNVLVAALLLVLLARDAVTFLVGWELMTLASYLLVTFDHQHDEVRRAGWVYLLSAHVGVLALFALFLGFANLGGSFDFATWIAARPGGGDALGLIALALIAFGVKAGVVPFHVWLPEAHAAAPSHVSALMSGMVIKIGLYGLVRTLTFLTPAAWWGPLLAGLGGLGAFIGIALALYQRDLKRALAYSSIENMGVMLLGLGVGYWGVTEGQPTIAVLGFTGALLHVWNHVLMKSLLFLAAGSVVHATGTRDLDQLGGLSRRMPRTAALFTVGAVAIAALPPLNGFASEWLIYLGLIDGAIGGAAGGAVLSVFAIAALATVGVLATLGFVRIVGVALLGQPRSPAAAHAHEAPRGMLAPMAGLAAGAIAMPLVGFALIGTLAPVVAQLAGRPLDVAPAGDALRRIAILSAALWGLLLTGFAAFTVLVRRRRRDDDTWGCGYAAPTAQMQYTATSFAELGQGMLPRLLRPRITRSQDGAPFPAAGRLRSDDRDPFTRSGYEPFLDRWAQRFARLRWVQRGLLNLYILYILVTLLLALGAVAALRWWAP